MKGGSYMVARRIRIALEHWDRMSVAFQEQTFGRQKASGAPLGGKTEFDTPDFHATDANGNYVIPETSHMRLAAPANNDGAQILRRSYSYNDGANFVAERWPPWHQGIEYDSGLFFQAYQKDPRTGFIKLFDKMSKIDALNQFTTHIGSAIFACPPGVQKGEYVGQGLFETAYLKPGLQERLWENPIVLDAGPLVRIFARGGVWRTGCRAGLAQTVPAISGKDPLLGDMGGLRTVLAIMALRLASRIAKTCLATPGGVKRGATMQGLTTACWRSIPARHSACRVARSISAPCKFMASSSRPYLDNLQTANGNEAEDGTRLWEMWYDQAFDHSRAESKSASRASIMNLSSASIPACS